MTRSKQGKDRAVHNLTCFPPSSRSFRKVSRRFTVNDAPRSRRAPLGLEPFWPGRAGDDVRTMTFARAGVILYSKGPASSRSGTRLSSPAAEAPGAASEAGLATRASAAGATGGLSSAGSATCRRSSERSITVPDSVAEGTSEYHHHHRVHSISASSQSVWSPLLRTPRVWTARYDP